MILMPDHPGYKCKVLYLSIAAVVAAGIENTAVAQEQEQEEAEEIVVTGSLLERPADFPQPVQLIGRDEMQLQQRGELSELFRDMPQVVGSIPIINLTIGGNNQTNTINLRGLGHRATLVLLNGQRQTVDGSYSAGVDVNNLAPSIMVERVEMLLDGASALYGSDAVAGVVNYRTRNDFEGVEFNLDMESIQTAPTGKPNYKFGFIAGSQGVDTSVVIGMESSQTSAILTEDVFGRERLELAFQSGFGNPGSFVPGTTGSIVAGRMPDPLCEDESLSGPTGLNAGLLDGTACRLPLSLSRPLMGNSERWSVLGIGTHNFENGISGTLELGATRTEDIVPFGYGLPFFTPLPVIPENNPGVIVASENNPEFDVQPYRFWGRLCSPVGGSRGCVTHDARTNTFRANASLDGPILNSSWEWRTAMGISRNESEFVNKDILNSRLMNAINGYGGQACQYTPETDPEGGFQGRGVCQWWNPFANHALADPGDPHYNDPELIDWIIGDRVREGTAELKTVEGVVSGDLWEMSGGPTGLALGYQWREQFYGVDWGALVNQGFDGERGFRFNQFALPDFSGTRSVNAIFGELIMYPVSNLEVQMAVRHEDIESVTTTDPKLGLIWNVSNRLTFRATAGTSFRMPRETQLFGKAQGGGVDRDIGGVSAANARGVTSGNPNLKPEESENWTVGMSWDVTDNFSLTLDYWDVAFENLVTGEDADVLMFNDIQDGFIDDPAFQLRPGSPNEVCEVTGRWDPDSGDPLPDDCMDGLDIEVVNTSYINQNSQNTSGFDFTADYGWDALGSTWRARLTGTLTTEYEINAIEQTYDGVGSFNSLNLGTPNPEWRGYISLDWNRGDHFARAIYRYTSALEEDDPSNTGTEERSFQTLDLVGGTMLPWLGGIEITGSIVNVFDEEDPIYDGSRSASGVYDWRKRVFRFGMTKTF